MIFLKHIIIFLIKRPNYSHFLPFLNRKLVLVVKCYTELISDFSEKSSELFGNSTWISFYGLINNNTIFHFKHVFEMFLCHPINTDVTFDLIRWNCFFFLFIFSFFFSSHRKLSCFHSTQPVLLNTAWVTKHKRPRGEDGFLLPRKKVSARPLSSSIVCIWSSRLIKIKAWLVDSWPVTHINVISIFKFLSCHILCSVSHLCH